MPITREPRREPWGLYEMHVTDPDGITLIFVEVPLATRCAKTPEVNATELRVNGQVISGDESQYTRVSGTQLFDSGSAQPPESGAVSLDLFLLIIVVITALAFDFTNGFHDTGNAMATSIASGALAPKTAVILSAVLNLVGAFLSTAVAATIAKGLIDANLVTLELVFAGLVGGIVWNLLTWLLGIPSSSSHALIGGIVGATIAAVGGHGVIWSGVVSKVLVPAVVAALLATFVAAAGTWLVYRVIRGLPGKRTESGFRHGQIGSASLVSLAHGTNDAQKTMGVIFLALMSYGAVSKTATMPPLWVIVSCAVAMAGGTYLGGWRIIRTLGKGLVEIKPPQGMAAESSSAAVILLSAHFGYALSTTQVATGSVLGSGVGKPGAEVRWGWPAGWWPHGSSRFHWPAWSGRSRTSWCTSLADIPAPSSVSAWCAWSRSASGCSHEKHEWTTRTSTPTGKAA
ncbi:hypothetical protein NIIDMKKI_65390 [Mycobacterium kansasii]|uniref:Phosphate transporter n=1 Tax=Mycobacterium kansasii TaxID=1768 RepID=A0A7G1INA8_MYCKA|nr:hypothetical protein NIIDMKKI_65390 [Mycobacterium kansasii]